MRGPRAQLKKVLAGAPVISSTVEVTKAGWPAAAAQASSSIPGMMPANSRRASSGRISSMRRGAAERAADCCHLLVLAQ